MNSRRILIGLVLAALAFPGQVPATVTNQVWFHFGDGGTAAQTDSSGNARNFQNGYFAGTPPLAGANAVGGVLGTSGYTSTNSMRFGLNGFVTELYNTGYTPPATNYGIEIWFQPQNKGIVTDNSQDPVAWLFSSGGSIFGLGPGGGSVIRVKDNGDGTSSLQAGVVLQGNSVNVVDFGPLILADTNRWIHLALVNDNGSLVFYTNAVPCATNDVPLTDPAGAMFIGRDGGHVSVDGFLDEARVFTFLPGQFSTSDLLYHASPRLISQPVGTTVWNGGAANFVANISQDPDNTFQWYRGATALSGQTSASLNLTTVTLTDSGSTFHCAVTNGALSLITSNAGLTVVPVQAANVAAYRNAVTAEASLIGYFPVDGSTGSTVANTVDGAHNGSLELGAVYDGQTNRAFGERAIYLRSNGDVRIPSNSAFEFGGGNGTLEALIYLASSPNGGNDWLFSVASDDGTAIRYAVGLTGDGTSVLYTNDSGVSLSWPVPVNLLNRFAHFAFSVSGGTTLTAYLDGQSLGSKTQTGFGSATGVPAWIGSATTNSPGLFNGTIDELAIYSTTLPGSTIAIHNSKFVFGTNTSAPIIVSQSASKTVYAGGSPVLSVAVSGTPPLTYQWKSNGVTVAGATSSSLTFSHIPVSSAAYTVFITNPFGSTNNTSSPINLTAIAPPDSYAAAIMGDNPSAYWRLNESSGTNLTDYAGELDGSYTGAFTLGASGITSDPAVSFGGGNGQIPYSSTLNPSSPFTVEFWANPAAAGTAATVLSSQLRSGASRFGFIVYQYNGGSGWTVQMGNAAGVTVQIIGATPAVAGNWYHGAITYDGGSNLVLYTFGYVDGTAGNAGNGNFIANPSAPFEIGIRNGGAIPYNGKIDEVAFYNYALTQNQLKAHVALGLPLKLAISPSTSVIADTKPSGPARDGLDSGATWVASESDLAATTRNGVMHFVATNNNQITTFGYPEFNSTNGTIMFWMRSAAVDTSANNEGAILFNWRPSGGNGGIAFIQHDAGTFFVQAMNNYNHFDSINTVTDNKWHHCAVTYDQSVSGSVTLYIDGALDSSALNSAPWFWPSGQTIELGRDSLYDGGYWRNYTGSMDDFRIYNRILSPTEISQAMGGAVVDASALTLRYNFDGPPKGYVVTWPYGSLQSAAAVTGSYSTLSNVPSPFPVAPASSPQKYFRGQR